MPKYPNRSDLRDVATYGDKKKREEATKKVPTGKAPTQKNLSVPGSLPDILRATERPTEPITQGADYGPGLSAIEAGVTLRTEEQAAYDELYAISQLFPTSELTSMFDRFKRQ